jgi:signal transduction histidine kinase
MVAFWLSLGVASVLTGAVLGWGMLVRSRREYLNSLRDRAIRAESEQQLRIDQARRMERAQIAREMHDVLAHRISLVSLHAGALEFRPDAPPDEIAMAAGVIRDSAHEALKELREVIGVLREGPASQPERPQPALLDVPELIDESREAGIRVHYSCVVASPGEMPATAGRAVYRVVQEALTNARKHAPGAEVTVSVGGGPGSGVWVEVRNPAPAPTGRGAAIGGSGAATVPGAGVGLVGLTERMELAGGRLEHGFTAGRGFRLRAEIPWQQ